MNLKKPITKTGSHEKTQRQKNPPDQQHPTPSITNPDQKTHKLKKITKSTTNKKTLPYLKKTAINQFKLKKKNKPGNQSLILQNKPPQKNTLG